MLAIASLAAARAMVRRPIPVSGAVNRTCGSPSSCSSAPATQSSSRSTASACPTTSERYSGSPAGMTTYSIGCAAGVVHRPRRRRLPASRGAHLLHRYPQLGGDAVGLPVLAVPIERISGAEEHWVHVRTTCLRGRRGRCRASVGHGFVVEEQVDPAGVVIGRSPNESSPQSSNSSTSSKSSTSVLLPRCSLPTFGDTSAGPPTVRPVHDHRSSPPAALPSPRGGEARRRRPRLGKLLMAAIRSLRACTKAIEFRMYAAYC